MSGAMAVEAEAGSSEPPSPTRDEDGGHTRRRGGWTAWLVRGGKKRVKLPVSASPGGKGKESVVDRAVANDASAQDARAPSLRTRDPRDVQGVVA